MLTRCSNRRSVGICFYGTDSLIRTIPALTNRIIVEYDVRAILELMRFGKGIGLVGNLTYAGDLAEFVPFMVLGAYLHVGEECDIWVE